jgi:hypothetical protein
LGEKVVDWSNMKVKKLNKTTRGMAGSFIVKSADLDNNMQVLVQFWKKQGGEFRQMPYKFPSKNLCDFFNEDPHFIPGVFEVSNIPSPLPCPVPRVKLLSYFQQQNFDVFKF